MPTDYRRYTGPETSTPYAAFVAGAARTPTDQRATLLRDDGKRVDGRTLDEPKPLFAKTGVVSQAMGSAYIESGNTKVICSVFAPREIPNRNEFSFEGQLYCEVKMATFSCRDRRAHAPDADERALASALRQALEPAVNRSSFPNFQVDIMVYILEHDGGCLAVAVTAAGLALADAAVPMHDIVAGSSLAVLGDKVFVDPTEAEEYACLNNADGNHGVVSLSLLSQIGEITDFTQIGSMDEACIASVMERLSQCVRRVLETSAATLLRGTARELDARHKAEERGKEKEELLKTRIREFNEKLASA